MTNDRYPEQHRSNGLLPRPAANETDFRRRARPPKRPPVRKIRFNWWDK